MRMTLRALTAAAAFLPATLLAQAKPAAPALDDAAIVGIFDIANTWDIETGSLAARKGTRQDVKDFGAMLARDHKMVQGQGRDLAAKLKVTPTPVANDFSLKVAHEAAMKKLQSLSGPAFDKAFLEHEVAYHKAVNGAVASTLIPNAQNKELKELLETGLKLFTEHQHHAEHLAEAAH